MRGGVGGERGCKSFRGKDVRNVRVLHATEGWGGEGSGEGIKERDKARERSQSYGAGRAEVWVPRFLPRLAPRTLPSSPAGPSIIAI